MRSSVYIGTYTGDRGPGGGSRGVYVADWDGEKGVLGAPRLLAELKHPSFLALHPVLPIVYAVSETGSFDGKPSGAVAAIRLEPSPGAVAATKPSGGVSPCHVAIDPKGSFAVAANYSSGTVGVLPLKEGIPGDPVAALTLEGHGPDPDRQKEPHAHSAFFDPTGDRFYVQDLGSDRVWGYALDRAARMVRPVDPPFTQLAPGSGPRHLAFHPRGPWCYVIGELDNTVTALSWDRPTGRLSPFQTATTLPADAPASLKSYTADIRISPDGAFLYGSNRGHDSIAVWRIDRESGRLELSGITPCGGEHPRNFALSPDGRWLLCANMNSHNVAVFRRDAESGALTQVSDTPAALPTCLVFAR